MTKTSLFELYERHTGKSSDKWSSYLHAYDELLDPWRDAPVRLLEIGVQNGGSLELWNEYFANNRAITGCDIDPRVADLRFSDPRVSVVVGDATDPTVVQQVLQRSGTFDVVIDDGSHHSRDIVRGFFAYAPHIVDGGIYVAEDLHCSYWRAFGGGLAEVRSSMSLFKALADVTNHEHWGVDQTRTAVVAPFVELLGVSSRDVVDVAATETLLARVHAVEFRNSICVVRMRAAHHNSLGTRCVVGTEHRFVLSKDQRNGSSLLRSDESNNPASDVSWLPASMQQRIRSLEWTVNRNAQRLDALRRRLGHVEAERGNVLAQVQDRDALLARQRRNELKLRESISWKVTEPIRLATKPLFRARAAVRQLGRTLRQAKSLREASAVVLNGARVQRKNQSSPVPAAAALDYREWLRRYDSIDETTMTLMRAEVSAMEHPPTISVVMPTYNSNLEWLRQAVASVRAQIYPHWQLCITDDASPDPSVGTLLAELAASDSRIRVTVREENGHIAAASNSALAVATGSWIALMDHDDVLPPHALFWVARTISRHPDAQLIYSDEDKLDEHGQRCDPYFKSDWNPDLFFSHNMFSHLGVFRADLLRLIGGFRLGTEGSQDYDLVLRCLLHVRAEQIVHIPKVLYSWRVHRQSTAHHADAKPYAMVAGERALNDHLARAGVKGRVELIPSGYRTRYELPTKLPLVSVIIPTRNGLHLLRQCIDSILSLTRYHEYEIIVVDNGSDDAETLRYLSKQSADNVIRVLRDDGDFNYSRLNNRAVDIARGEILALLNNDIEVISPDWLGEMVGIAIQSSVGAVGARLWYPDMTLQHGGVLLGVAQIAGHAHKHVPRDNAGYFGRASLQQSFSAVTGACLVVRKDHYLAVGGLDEDELTVAYNDVDFCLRLRAHGLRNVWTPYAELFHHEMATRGDDADPVRRPRLLRESEVMKRRWGQLLPFDPAYNPNLTLDSEDFGLAWPPRVHPDFAL